MSNDCQFFLSAIGTEESLCEFYQLFRNKDPKRMVLGTLSKESRMHHRKSPNLYQHAYNLRGIYFDGICPGGIAEAFLDSKGGHSAPITTLLKESKRLHLGIEVFGRSLETGIDEYLRMLDGKLQVRETYYLSILNTKSASEEEIQEFLDRNSDFFDPDEDTLEDYMDDNGNIILGGVPYFKMFDMIDHVIDLKKLLKYHQKEEELKLKRKAEMEEKKKLQKEAKKQAKKKKIAQAKSNPAPMVGAGIKPPYMGPNRPPMQIQAGVKPSRPVLKPTPTDKKTE